MSLQPEPRDYHAILGVARTASLKEIRAAFRARARELHPDKNPQRDTTEDFQRIQEAHAALTRGAQKRRHDYKAPPPEPAPPRRWRIYGFAGLAVAILAVALSSYLIYGPATNEPTDPLRWAAELDKGAQSLPRGPPKPAVVEVIGREGRKYLLAGDDHRRLTPIHDRLATEANDLRKRKENLDARRAVLDKEQRELGASEYGLLMAFRVKVDAFNRDGAALRRHAELHAAEVEDYFKEIERLAQRDR